MFCIRNGRVDRSTNDLLILCATGVGIMCASCVSVVRGRWCTEMAAAVRPGAGRAVWTVDQPDEQALHRHERPAGQAEDRSHPNVEEEIPGVFDFRDAVQLYQSPQSYGPRPGAFPEDTEGGRVSRVRSLLEVRVPHKHIDEPTS